MPRTGSAKRRATCNSPGKRSRAEFSSGPAFAAQQAAEKAVKALYQGLGGEARGHSVTQLLAALPSAARPSEQLVETAKELDKHYIAPRYPNSYPEGAPMDFYTRAEAERAVAGAERVIEHCKSHLFR